MNKLLTFNWTRVVLDYETIYEDLSGAILDDGTHLDEITELIHNITSYQDVYDLNENEVISLGQRDALIEALERSASDSRFNQ